MVLEYWAQKQQKHGNEGAAKKARELLKEYGDVPLPPTLTLQSKEQQEEVLRFSQEARQGLEKEGYLIYKLGGQSIRSLKEQGKRFDSTWHRDFPHFEALTSRVSEVAINPNQLFLPNSNRKTFKQQEEIVKGLFEELSRRIPSVEAIIGEVPDYLELAFNHLRETSGRLFGEEYKYGYTRTKTPTEASLMAGVGNFDARLGLDIKRWGRDNGAANDLWITALVVPARAALEL